MFRPALRLIAIALLLVCRAAAHATGTADDYAAARKAFQEAYARAAAGIVESGAADGASLRSYPLYPYLEAARIRGVLEHASGDAAAAADPRAAAFLATYGALPVGRSLRRTWLDSLAHRSQWTVFLAQYRESSATDASRCQSFIARIELGRTDDLARDIARQWLTPRSLPDCERAFTWLKDSGALSASLIEQRARSALESGNVAFARQMIEQLPAERSGALTQWVALIEHPESIIDGLIAAPDTPVESAALLAGWRRLAHQDPGAAKERFAKLVHARGLDERSASPYALILARSLAWSRDPAALDFFARVVPADLDDASLEWRARAALWSRNWTRASESLDALSDRLRGSARWRYWSARIAEQLGDGARARSTYEALLTDDNFYSAMAAAHLSRSVTPHPQDLAADAKTLADIERVPALERARELFLCGLNPEANAEWQLGYGSLSDSERLQAIRLAASWGWYDQAVATATSLGVFNDYALLYPRPFDADVTAAAHRARLAPEIVYGVIRQESLYRADAVSNAEARGLMQLQLETARRTARFLRLPRPSATDLFDASINTSLGAGRLRMLLDEFDGQISVALAGYNAGVNAASRWLPAQPIDADIWIENIPYNETREYVERVLWHSLMFSWLGTPEEPPRADAWLAPITPTSHTASGRLAATEARQR
jgi:soluble lytic murein transglycosylase